MALPQLLGADGDAVTVVQGAGGDAGEVTLDGVIVPGPIDTELFNRTNHGSISRTINRSITENPVHGSNAGSLFNLTSSPEGA